jgi:DNA-binding GntR family transcriptional regulator
VDSVYDQILSWLNDRGLSGPETFHAAALAEELQVSRTPVNMALVRLECEGLIEKDKGRGWTTVPLCLQEIDGIFDLKDLLEPLTARRAAENITPEAAATLLGIVEEMEQASETDDLEGWLAADNRYHNLLHDLVGNRFLSKFQEQLNNQLYRLEVGHFALEGRMETACEEHRRIAEAIAAGRPDRAAECALTHVRTLRTSMLSVVKNVLIPFLGQEF